MVKAETSYSSLKLHVVLIMLAFHLLTHPMSSGSVLVSSVSREIESPHCLQSVNPIETRLRIVSLPATAKTSPICGPLNGDFWLPGRASGLPLAVPRPWLYDPVNRGITTPA